jgi:PAS domain S-box-containing protein
MRTVRNLTQQLGAIVKQIFQKQRESTGVSKPGESFAAYQGNEQNALHSENLLYRSTFDHMIEGCQIIASNWEYLYINNTAEKHNRRPKEELLGNKYAEMWPGIENTQVYSLIKQCLEARTTHLMENKFIYPDGSAGWFELSIQPIPEGVFILSVDITERKHVQEEIITARERAEEIGNNLLAMNEEYESINEELRQTNEELYAAKEKAEKSEAKYKKAVVGLKKAQSVAKMGSWEWYIPENRMDCTSEMYSIFGLEEGANHGTLEEITRRCIHPDDLERVKQTNSLILESGIVIPMEYRIILPDGSIKVIWAEAGEIICDEQSKPKVLSGIVQDITERKKTEEQLRESESKFRKIYEDGPYGMAFVNLDFRFIMANSTFCNMIGYSEDELKTKTFQDITHPEDVGIDVQNVHKLIRKEIAVLKTEKRYTRKDNRVICTSLTVTANYNNEGQFLYNVAMIEDITERKLAEEKLKEALERTSTIISTSPYAIVVTDSIGVVNVWNEAAERIFGWTGDEIIGKRNFAFSAGKIEEIQKLRNAVASGKIVKDFETSSLHKSGAEIQVRFSASPLRDGRGNIIGILSVVEDITEKKKMLDDLIQSKNKAEESDQLKTAFLHNISHEIRTPLNAIIGFSSILENPDLPSAKRKIYVDIIHNSSDQLLSIMEDIMNIATIDAGQEHIHETKTNINTTLKLLYQQFATKAQKQAIEFKHAISLSNTEATILTDSTKLLQIISNLLVNAFKFTKEGHIFFGYIVKDNNLEFYVEDTGIGISPEMHQEIFKRFRQVETTPNRHYGGSGLGLSISKAYVELLGGKLWLTSEVGKGATFYFTLPYKKTNAPVVEEPLPKQKTMPSGESKTILIAEDEDFNYLLLEEILCNFKIIRAVNGLEAVNICQANANIDLVLMDIKMPLLNGYDATRRIHEFRPQLPVIAVTAYSAEVDKNKFFTYGCCDFISKPLKEELLIHKIQEHLGK